MLDKVVWGLAVLVALALDVWLIRLARRFWKRRGVGDSQQQGEVHMLGAFSPILTWLRYRRLPGFEGPWRWPTLTVTRDTLSDSASAQLTQSEPHSTLWELKFGWGVPERLAVETKPTGPVVGWGVSRRVRVPTIRYVADWLRALPYNLWRWLAARPRLVAGAAGLGAFVLAVYAQIQFTLAKPVELVFGLWLFAGAVALFLFVARRHRSSWDVVAVSSGAQVTSSPSWLVPHRDFRIGLLILAMVLGIGNALFVDAVRIDAVVHWETIVFWLLSLVAYCLALFPRPEQRLAKLSRTQAQFWCLILLVTLVAFAARFHALGRVPWVMENDEAGLGREALNVLEGRLVHPFQTYRSYSSLEIFALAVPVRVFGETKFALRLLSALGGWLAIPVLAVVVKRLFGPRVAVASAALLAISHSAIHFSHTTVAASTFDPLLSAVSLYFVYRAVHDRAWVWWALSGVSLGMSIYGYAGSRVIPVVAGAYLLFNGRLLVQAWRGLGVMVGSFVLAVAPMASHVLRDPSAFNNRFNAVGIIQSGWLEHALVQRGLPLWSTIWQQFSDALLIFNYHPMALFYISSLPMLGLLTGALFVPGLVHALGRGRDPRFLLLNAWLWVPLVAGQMLMLVPAASGYRTLILVAPACVLAGLVLIKMTEAVGAIFQAHQHWVFGLIALVLVWEGWFNLNYYFGEWAPQSRYTDFNTTTASLMADYMKTLGREYRTYVFGTPRFRAAGWAAFPYLARGMEWVDIQESLPTARPQLKVDQPSAFIFLPERSAEVNQLQAWYPGGRVTTQTIGEQLYFVSYELPTAPTR